MDWQAQGAIKALVKDARDRGWTIILLSDGALSITAPDDGSQVLQDLLQGARHAIRAYLKIEVEDLSNKKQCAAISGFVWNGDH